MTYSDLIKKRFEIASKRRWDKVIVAVDLHDTVMNSEKYNAAIKNSQTVRHASKWAVYQQAILPLQMLTKRTDVKLVWYTGTDEKTLEIITSMLFAEYSIKFEGIAGGDEFELVHEGQSFENKPCFDILLEDKAGFDPEEDWKEVLKGINNNVLI